MTSEGGQPVAHDEPDKARQGKVPLAEGHENEQDENHHQAHPQARMVTRSIGWFLCLTDFFHPLPLKPIRLPESLEDQVHTITDTPISLDAI